MKHWMMWLVIFIGILLIAACTKLPDDILIAKGKQLEEEGKFEDAIKTFRKVVKIHSKSPLCVEAQYHIASIQANGLQDFNAAVNTFSSLVEKYPGTKFTPQAQFMIGFIYNNNLADTSRARIAYEKFISDYPTHELVLSANWELDNLGKSIEDISALMNLEPNSEEVTNK